LDVELPQKYRSGAIILIVAPSQESFCSPSYLMSAQSPVKNCNFRIVNQIIPVSELSSFDTVDLSPKHPVRERKSLDYDISHTSASQMFAGFDEQCARAERCKNIYSGIYELLLKRL
jgi:hypothetical protein